MPHVLILCLHRPDRSPSQRFRFEQYLPYLEQNGYSFKFSYLLNENDDRVFYSPGKLAGKAWILVKSIAQRSWEVLTAKRYDLCFIQREAFMLGTSLFERLIARQIPVIFDFDDSIWMQQVSEANKGLAFLKNAAKTSDIIRAAHLVLAGNEYLADYARDYNSNVQIFPTTIDTDKYVNAVRKHGDAPVCIGWSGSFSTIQHFALVLPALVEIQKQYKERVCFKVIGDGNYYSSDLGVQGLPWRANTEVEDLSTIDIGLMPLPDDEWARGKCGLKGLQYMALGIPTLMSPVGVNSKIISDGENGFLPSSMEEYVLRLSQLIDDRLLRERIGEAGRATVQRHFSVIANRQRFLATLNEAIDLAPSRASRSRKRSN